MSLRFTDADKAFYVAEYLRELKETDSLPGRSLCELYGHEQPGQMGLEVDGETILRWADEVCARLSRA
jgi:hypothetical protein